MIKLYVKKMFKDVQTPIKANPDDSGFDVYSYEFKRIYRHFGSNSERCIDTPEDIKNEIRDNSIELNYLERILVGTGLIVTLNEPGYEIQLRPRSGLSLKEGLTIGNTLGTIDNSYRGELGIILVNISRKTRTIKLGERIAQIVPAVVLLPEIEVVDTLPETLRGEGGFGHSGTK